MKKVLYIVSTLKDCAPNKQLFEIVRHLPKEEYRIKILTLSPEPENSKREEFLSNGIQADSLNMGRPAWLVAGKRRVKQKILEEKPDIIHTSGIRADILMARLQLSIPWCATIRCNVMEDYVNKYGRLQGRIMIWQHLKAIERMRIPVCCSRTLRKIYEERLQKDMLAIQDGIDIRRYHYDRDERAAAREKIGAGTSAVFVMSGHLTEGKDPMSILRAFCGLFQKQEAVLYVLGDGPLRKKCESIACGNVIYEGYVKNVEQYLLAADIYVSASLTEGLPNSVLEAGASGLTVILSDIPQHREIFPYENESVFYFDVKDVEGLRKQMRKAQRQWNQGDRERISDTIIKQFDSRRMSGEYQRLYEKLIEG